MLADAGIHFAGHAVGTKADRDLRKQLAALSLSALYKRVCDRDDIDKDALQEAFGAILDVLWLSDRFLEDCSTHHRSDCVRRGVVRREGGYGGVCVRRRVLGAAP